MKRALAASSFLATVTLASSWPASASAADPPPPPDARVPLTASFPVVELAGIGVAAAWYASLVALQGPIVQARLGSATAESCPACPLGGPSGLDRSISDALYAGPHAGPFLGGFPNALGLAVGPAVAAVFYAEDAVLTWTTGSGVTGNRNADHELFALGEAFFTAMALNQTVKVTTGRLRPYYELGRGPSLPAPPDTNLSFFSGHATASFTLASFITRDATDWLVSHPLRESSPLERAVLGRILPAVALYGAATVVGVSRIIDQDHYFTDVALGAAVGTLLGNVVYALHFDGNGVPRAGVARGMQASVVPFPGGVGVAGRY